MISFTVGYTLTNRGRHIKSALKAIKSFILTHSHFILFLDETDATDREIGLDGRKLFDRLKREGSLKNFEFIISQDQEVGLNYIHSKSFTIRKEKLEQINKADLRFPQGKSEHYKQHRLIVYSKFKNTHINFIVQHNSAFIRPLRRYVQSVNAMKLLSKIQSINNISFLIRDQNTWIPGEGRLERFLRRSYKLLCLTDNVKRSYNLANLEGDTGGLNKLAFSLIRSGIAPFINRNVITIMDKVESICMSKNTFEKEIVDYKTSHIGINGLDHGLLATDVTIR